MVNFTILAGGLTSSFIVTYLFNQDTSSLTVLGQSPTGPNSSWISSHPANKTILYAANEIETGPGALQSFVINSNGSLTGPVDTVSAGGVGSAFAGGLSTGQVAIANYAGGNAEIIPTTSDPLHFARNATLITFPPPAGGVSHPHMALQYGDEVFIPDLGGDKIWRLVENGSPGNWEIHGLIEQPEGSGPRHIAIHNNELYTLHELDSTLTVQAVPPAPNGTSPFLGNVTITPPNPPDGALFAAAEILIPAPTANFPVAYIYVSNRNTGTVDPRGDTIAIYERNNGSGSALTLVAQVYTGLNQIRGMEIGNAENGGEAYLIAGGVAGTAGVVVFKRTGGGRGLEVVARNTDVPTRSTFVWL